MSFQLTMLLVLNNWAQDNILSPGSMKKTETLLKWLVTGYKPVFASCQNCQSYFPSIATVRDCLLPAKIAVCDKRLPARNVQVLPAENFDRKQNHPDSLCRKPVFVNSSLGRNQEIEDCLVSEEAKYDVQSKQEAKN